jgi:2-oxoglutarate ferredoxin oxidoreductase subunit gamma
VIGDRPVSSPVVQHPRALLAMNLPSLDKFEPLVKSGGLIVLNTSLINRDPLRTDVRLVRVPANEIALELGNPRGANMVALGAYLGATHVVSLGAVGNLVRETFAGKPKVIEANLAALKRGWEHGEQSIAGAPAAAEVGA